MVHIKKVDILIIASIIFNILLLIDYYIVGTIIAVVVIGIGTVSIRAKSKTRWKDVGKLSIFISFLFILMNPLPQYWIPQFERRWMDNRTDLIEPDHPVMQELNSSFQTWFLSNYSHDFKQETDFETQVRAVDIYIRTIRFQYTLDNFNYYAYDHLPTLDEIIATEDSDGKWHDDCDGISLMTTSFLIYLGYQNTYISEVTYHYHTIVFEAGINPKTEQGYLSGISLYQGRVMNVSNGLSDKVSYYLFNQSELFIPPTRTLIQSIGEILVDGNVYKYDLLEIFMGEITGLPIILNLALIFVLSIFIILGLNKYIRIGKPEILPNPARSTTTRITKKEILILSSMLFAVFVLEFGLAFAAVHLSKDLTFLCNPLMIVSIIVIILILKKKNQTLIEKEN